MSRGYPTSSSPLPHNRPEICPGYAANIKYSNSATAPASFAACTYTPVANYDPAVRYVCLNPQGTFAGSTGTPPSFQLSINAQVN